MAEKKMTKAEERRIVEGKCQDLARRITIGGKISELLEANGLQLKEGKTNADLNNAIRKGVKRGTGDINREIREAGYAMESMLQLKKEEKK